MAGYQSKLTTFTQRPYYDDFDINKKFMQILFRPGLGVQARELTQMQTILQDQVARMGSHFFDNGAKIIGGETSLKQKIEYIKIPSSLPIDTKYQYIGGTVSKGSLVGKITHYIPSTTTDPATIYVEYTSSEGHIQSFSSTSVYKINVTNGGTGYTSPPTITMLGTGTGATAIATVTAGVITDITVTNGGSGYVTDPTSSSFPTVVIGVTGTGTGASATVEMINSDITFSILNTETQLYEDFTSSIDQSGIGFGALAFINDGIYFINGRFAIVNRQTLVVSKYIDITESVNEVSLGFLVEDKIIYPEDDNSLYDNAIGSPNESAPGATRYKMDLTFVVKPTDESVKNFVQLIVLQSGTATTPPNQTDYSQLFLDIFAKRTYDESGDYVINDFSLDLREHLDNGTNLGKYTASNGGDSTKMVAIMGPGKAYVRGYEVNKTANYPAMVIDKSRDTNTVNDVYVSNPYETFVYVDLNPSGTTPAGSVTNVPFDLFSRNALIEFKNSSNVVLFTAQPMGIEHFSGTIYKIYFTQLKTIISNSTFNNVSYISQSGKLAPLASLTGIDAINVNTANSNLILNIPYSYVKNIFGTLLQPYKSYNGTVSTNKITLTDTAVQFVSNSNSYVVCIEGVGYVTPISINTQTGVVELDLASGYNSMNYTVIANVAKNNYTYKTKTILTVTDELHTCYSPSEISSVKLNNTDIISVSSISINDGNGYVDYTSHYELDNGQKSDVYDFGYINLKEGSNAPTQGVVKISYTYFNHSTSGDFFTVDSYSTIPYENIPYYNDTFLANVIDLRTSITNPPTSIVPATDIIIDYNYYLARIDNIILNSKGMFNIIRGVPSLSPKVPIDSDDSITLYTLRIPPYTFKVSDILVDKKNYKRYTMRDISELEKRIENLEYYTQLSLLESDIQGKEFFDKFKSGFIVDNFESLTTGDVQNPLHTVAIDFSKGEMCAETVTTHVNLEMSSNSNTRNNDGIITLPYTEISHITQGLASTLVRLQPFAQYAWHGRVKLTPNVDRWVSYQYAPDLTLDGGTYPGGTSANTIQNKVWDLAAKVFVGQENAISRGDGSLGASSSTSSTTLIGKSTNRWGHVTGREWRTTTTTSQTTYVGTRTIDVGAIPWIRSRWVQFKISGLKPNTVVKPYFDGVDVSQYCYQTVDNITPYPTWYYWYYWYFWYDMGWWNTYQSNTQILKSNGAGVINGWFLIPNNSNIRFKTGVRKFEVKDVLENPSTTASGNYDAAGTSVTLQNVFVTTRVVDTRDYWYDPVAQSFVLNNPEGAFITSMDLYFGPEADDIAGVDGTPVTLQICDMVNGYPGKSVVASVDVPVYHGSADATVPTKFTFDHPVYLEPNKEYAFVVLSNSEDLALWCSELGQKSVRPGDINTFTGEYINKQPYLGTMFKSQNHSTWTAEQSQDIKFTIYRAKFDNTVTGNVVFTNKILDSDMDGEANIFKKLLQDNPMSVSYGPNLDIIANGSGYTSASFSFTGGGGSGFAATPILRGTLDHVNVSLGGSGYTTASASVVGTGTGATVSVTVSGGAVTAVTVTNAGTGYDPATTSILITGDGIGASAIPIVFASITGFQITNHGTGYTSAPSITITGDGTGADVAVTYDDGSTVFVKHKNHGFKVGDTVTITYPTDPNYNGGNSIVLGDFTIADLSGSHIITSETIDGYSFSVTSTTNTQTVQNGGGVQITASQVIPYSLVRLNTDAVVLNGTGLDWSMKAKGYYSTLPIDSLKYGIIEDKLIDLGSLKVVKSNNDQSIQLTASLTSPNEYISPVVDVHKVGLYVVTHRINEFNDSAILDDSSTTYEVNNSISRYATKNVTLINPSNELQLYLDNNLLSGTKVDVYCKVSTKPTSVTLDDVPWKKMTVVSGNNFNDIGEFTETKYQYDSPEDFTNFVIKVVYSSSIQRGDARYRAIVPRSKRLRAIALKN